MGERKEMDKKPKQAPKKELTSKKDIFPSPRGTFRDTEGLDEDVHIEVILKDDEKSRRPSDPKHPYDEN